MQKDINFRNLEVSLGRIDSLLNLAISTIENSSDDGDKMDQVVDLLETVLDLLPHEQISEIVAQKRRERELEKERFKK